MIKYRLPHTCKCKLLSLLFFVHLTLSHDNDDIRITYIWVFIFQFLTASAASTILPPRIPSFTNFNFSPTSTITLTNYKTFLFSLTCLRFSLTKDLIGKLFVHHHRNPSPLRHLKLRRHISISADFDPIFDPDLNKPYSSAILVN